MSTNPPRTTRAETNGDMHCEANGAPSSAANRQKRPANLHRISTVRERQGMSLRSVSRQMHVDVRRLRSEEDESSDLLLSTLYLWQKVLDVPIAELLVESENTLSPPVMERARMLKIMKTVAAILERNNSAAIDRLATMLREQLIELMPELEEVTPWHSVGQRRSSQEYGKVFEQMISDDFFSD